MKILLTDGSHKNTLAIMRFLGKEKHLIDILHHKKSAPAYSKHCHELIICPKTNKESEYFHFILNLVQNRNYDILIPVGIESIVALSKHLPELRKFVKIEFSDYNTIQVALEKKLTFQYAEKKGIKHPMTVYPNNIDEAIRLSENLTFPVIIKSSNENVIKFPTIYVDNKLQLIENLNILVKTETEKIEKNFPLIQERIFGKGYGFFAIYQNGVCKKVFMHERIRENPVSGGVSTSAKSYYDNKLIEAGKEIMAGLNWHGQVMVEFKKDINTGEYKLIEINPKFWGSLELCLSSGMNFPLYLCEMAMDKELEYSESYNRKRIFLWLISVNGELYRLFQKPSDIFVLIRDWFRFSSRSDIWISDFKPTLVQIGYYLFFVKNSIVSFFKKK